MTVIIFKTDCSHCKHCLYHHWHTAFYQWLGCPRLLGTQLCWSSWCKHIEGCRESGPKYLKNSAVKQVIVSHMLWEQSDQTSVL